LQKFVDNRIVVSQSTFFLDVLLQLVVGCVDLVEVAGIGTRFGTADVVATRADNGPLVQPFVALEADAQGLALFEAGQGHVRLEHDLEHAVFLVTLVPVTSAAITSELLD
jgi:hypothetical protein